MRRLAFVILALALAPAASAEAGRQPLAIPVTEPQPAALTVDLFTPSGDGPQPAVILLHGCSGITPAVTAWAMWLQSEGYYPDARHAFDAANLRGRVHVAVARGGKGATIEHNPRAHEDAEKQVRRFLQAQLGP